MHLKNKIVSLSLKFDTLIIYLLILIVITIAFGSFPLWMKNWNEKKLNALLAFSASFLMGISFLHLMPETYESLGFNGGAFILFGFIGQSVLQKYTHGLEHGHVHGPQHLGNSSVWSIILGMSFHALFEGIPLGLDQTHFSAYFMAILLHKIPEAMVVVAFLCLLDQQRHKKRAWLFLILFSLLTPISALVAGKMGSNLNLEQYSIYILAIISGMFLQIATTIYFEISNAKHVIRKYKWLFIILGLVLSLIFVNI